MRPVIGAVALGFFSAQVFAALPVVPAKDQTALLKSSDPKLRANKKLAYDFYRIVLQGRRLDQAGKYMREDYIQHNPNADTGLKGFKAYFAPNLWTVWWRFKPRANT